MANCRVRMTDDGQLVIPADVRRQLGLATGDEVILDVTDGALRIRSVQRAIASTQSLVRQYVAPEKSLAAELIDDRRRSAEND